ncbi:trigger factor [Sphaerobacter sp.]|uniref:trigger factor n=1 Tax=Sphaerobacter sp. TaxID=2099654 RepID=UPI001DA927C5|nr:trigger factor [Sphaerobacter sp.]MBX5444045.1 trigger factor [Sphaerobacter sp.]
MRVSVEKLPQSSVRLDIVADSDEFNQALDRAFRRVNQQVRIPGFRPGKAPRFILEQRLGREVLVEEAQREIMDTLYRRALDQENLIPVSDPQVDVYQDEPVGFRVEVQVYPEVDLGDYRSIRLDPREVEVTDADVDEALAEVQRANAVWVEPAEKRAPKDGDQVIIDLEVTRDGEPFQEPLQGADFVLGESSLFSQIEEAIKSLHPGETAEFDITFEEDDEKVSPEIRGSTLHYRLTLNEIKERELPELDDDLAKSVGDYETLDDLRAAIREDLLRSRALAARAEFYDQAVEALAKQATLEIPEAMVTSQLDREVEQLRTRLAQQGSSLEEYLRFEGQTLEEFKESRREDAVRRLRNSLVLEAFAEAEGIDVDQEDLLGEIERLSNQSQNPDQMRQIYSSPYFTDLLMSELKDRKVMDRLVELVTEGRGAVIGEAAEVLARAEAGVTAEPEQAAAAPEGDEAENTDDSQETQDAEDASSKAAPEDGAAVTVGAAEEASAASAEEEAEEAESQESTG